MPRSFLVKKGKDYHYHRRAHHRGNVTDGAMTSVPESAAVSGLVTSSAAVTPFTPLPLQTFQPAAFSLAKGPYLQDVFSRYSQSLQVLREINLKYAQQQPAQSSPKVSEPDTPERSLTVPECKTPVKEWKLMAEDVENAAGTVDLPRGEAATLSPTRPREVPSSPGSGTATLGGQPDYTYDATPGGQTNYTYDMFMISDGRARRRRRKSMDSVEETASEDKAKARYTCSECGKSYATSSNLSRHKQTHRSLDSQSAKQCPHCNKVYVSMPALSMHILTHNLKHACPTCKKSFSRPWLLQGHMRSHSGEKPYGCAHCGKAFADRSNLRAHMQTHSAQKSFQCQRCNKTFALKSYLNKHYESACLKD